MKWLSVIIMLGFAAFCAFAVWDLRRELRFMLEHKEKMPNRSIVIQLKTIWWMLWLNFMFHAATAFDNCD